MEKTAILIQARSTSSRLPGKMTMGLGGVPLFEHVYRRCKAAHDNVIFLVPFGDKLVEHLKEKDIPFFEGDEQDVLDRYHQAMKFFKLYRAVRITGDCPFINPAEIVYGLHFMDKTKSNFVTNCYHKCIDGYEVEIFTHDALRWAAMYEQREHVTDVFKDNLCKFCAAGFKWAAWQCPFPVSWFPKLSVDTEEDLNRCEQIYKELKEGLC